MRKLLSSQFGGKCEIGQVPEQQVVVFMYDINSLNEVTRLSQ